MNATQLLQAVPLFRGLDEERLRRISARLAERRLSAGELLFREGDPGDVLYVVAEGEIEIFLGTGTREQRLRLLGPGSYLGELALLDDVPRSTSARATRPAWLLVGSRDLVMAEVLSTPEASRAMLAEMGRRLRSATSMVGGQVARNALQELEGQLTFAQRLAERVATFNGSWGSFLGILVITAAWVAVNAAPQGAFDPYPYQFFNLVLAVVVTLQGPMLMMSQNRQALRDRAQAAADYELNLKNELGIQALAAGQARLEERLGRLEAGVGVATSRAAGPTDGGSKGGGR
jgi:uncharacterized membrane protein